MSNCDLLALLSATALGLHNCLDDDQFALLADLYTALGDLMAVLITNDEIQENCCKKKQAEGEDEPSVSGPIA